MFDPKRKPWIDMNQAETQHMIEQVRKCPSGALNFFVNEKQPGGKDNSGID